jgi:tripartite-type tricarboxylate transporter receptor subunit TctC
MRIGVGLAERWLSTAGRCICVHALLLLGTMTLPVIPGIAATTDYPLRPIRLVVPFAAGGTSDILGRILSARMQDAVGQRWVVDNRGGAGGMIGTDIAAKATADGYTLVLGSNATHAIVPLLQKKPPYDPVKDFAPVGMVAITPTLLAVNNDLPVKSVKDLIVLAKAKPNTLAYASSGIGSATHVAGEMLGTIAGIQLTHVPYKSASAAYPDVFSGRVAMIFDTALSMAQHLKAERLRPLAVTTPLRAKNLPDVPTMSEAGLPGYAMTLWLGVFAPAGTPATVITQLNTAMNRALSSPDVREQMAQQGAEVSYGAPSDLLAAVKTDLTRMGAIIKAAKIEAQ